MEMDDLIEELKDAPRLEPALAVLPDPDLRRLLGHLGREQPGRSCWVQDLLHGAAMLEAVMRWTGQRNAGGGL